MMKTKYGEEINPDDFPYFGQFGDYVRKNIDSEWGKDKEREITKKRKYEVYLNAVAEVSMVIFLEAKKRRKRLQNKRLKRIIATGALIF